MAIPHAAADAFVCAVHAIIAQVIPADTTVIISASCLGFQSFRIPRTARPANTNINAGSAHFWLFCTTAVVNNAARTAKTSVWVRPRCPPSRLESLFSRVVR